MNAALLEASGVRHRLGRRWVLDGIDLSVRTGSLMCLLGPNGAGKSTLLRLLSGELDASEGSVRFHERDLSTWVPAVLAQRRAVMCQKPNAAFEFHGTEVVLLGRYPHCQGRPGRNDERIAQQALADAEASHLDWRIVSTLSGGENARVHFARALAQVAYEDDGLPRALFLDEPTASLDLAHQHALMRLARELAHGRGLAVVAVVHDLNLAARYADEVVLLAEGRIAASGTPLEVLTREHVRTCFGVDVIAVPAAGQIAPALLVTA